MQENNRPSQSFYDSLSQIMKILKQVIVLFEKLIIETTRQLPVSYISCQLNSKTQLLSAIAEKKFEQDQDTGKYVVPRFICRLKETIIQYEQHYVQRLAFTPIRSYLKDTTLVLKGFQHDRDLSRMLRKQAMMIARYSESIPLQIECQQGITPRKETRIKLIGKTMVKTPTAKRHTPISNDSKELSLTKILEIISHRFSLMSGLGLDSNHFRSLLLQTRNKTSVLTEDCLERNQYIKQQMDLYASKHANFLKRKSQLKKRPRIRQDRRSNTEITEIMQLRMNNQKKRMKTETDFNVRHKQRGEKEQTRKNIENLLVDPGQVSILMYRAKTIKGRKDVCQNRKSPLEMKNVVMTGDYFDHPREESNSKSNHIYLPKKMSDFYPRGYTSPKRSFYNNFKTRGDTTSGAQNSLK